MKTVKALSLPYKFWKALFRWEDNEAIPDSISILMGMILLGGCVAWVVLGIYCDPRLIAIPVVLMLGAVR